jgi:hypothetical protein
MVLTYQATLIHQSPKATIEWLPEGKVVRKTFTGFIFGEEMKSAFQAGLNALKQHKGCK